MPSKIATVNTASKGLSPENWLNTIWVVTRVMGIVGLPPAVISLEADSVPGVLWLDPDDDEVIVVLDCETNPARLAIETDKAIMTMHISERLSEGATLALIGLCTMRDLRWDIIPAGPDEDDSVQQSEPDDTKPG